MSGVSTGTVLAGASLATALGGMAMNVAGQLQQAAAASAQARYQQGMMEYNRQVMERNAGLAIQQGKADEERQRLKTGQLIGSQRAAIASQGGDPNSGSYLDLQADTASAGETDALTIRSNAAMRAYGFRLQGAGLGAQGGLYGMQAANATAALPFGIGSSLLSGASSITNKAFDWMRWSGGGGVGAGGTGPSGYSGSVWGSGGDYGSSV